MPIEIPDEKKKRIIGSIQRYFRDEMEEEIGELKAKLLLDFWMKEIAPAVYNVAVAEVQSFIQEKVADADATCFKPEFTYWKR
jgi:uncharacterized protein (DUF2164 family)